MLYFCDKRVNMRSNKYHIVCNNNRGNQDKNLRRLRSQIYKVTDNDREYLSSWTCGNGSVEYGGPRVPRHIQKLSQHKQKFHGTSKNCHGTNKNFTAQTKTVTAQKKNLTAQTKISRHKQEDSRRKSRFSAELPEVDLSAMRGYPANSNMAETQFDDDFETKENDAEQDSEEASFGIIFWEALSTKKSFCSYWKTMALKWA